MVDLNSSNNGLIIPEASPVIPPNIQALIDKILKVFEQGQERLQQTAIQEKKIMFWETGRLIKEDLLENKERAEYGDSLFETLAIILKINQRTLYQCLQFYEEYPQILYTCTKLTWSHYRTLLGILDMKQRQKYEEIIINQNLSIRKFQDLIRKDKNPDQSSNPPSPSNLAIIRGKPYVYKLKIVQGQLKLDQGFHFYVPNQYADISPEIIFESEKENNDYSFTPTTHLAAPHYTYKAYIAEIVDGDTLWVNIDLGFGNYTSQKLRLRAINTPELSSIAGQKAFDYVSSCLKDCKFIAIKTYWRDKFNRYLADVFYDKTELDLEKLVQTGKFLNQELLDLGMAERY